MVVWLTVAELLLGANASSAVATPSASEGAPGAEFVMAGSKWSVDISSAVELAFDVISILAAAWKLSADVIVSSPEVEAMTAVVVAVAC